MKKPKGSPVKEEKEEATADGLELLSIGSLYSGTWDKKYWSSSRGKDRYPYPVGYQAVRAHDGIRYQIEIHEGSKGPLFMINTADGCSFYGQTPNMAWDRFQRKGFHDTKIWHRKRFSCDGVEFFGFKNPSVQRLLRELVASIGGTAEQRIISSSHCKVTSEVDRENEIPCAESHLDLVSCLAYPKFTRKRSQRPKNPKTGLIIGLGFKRSDQGLVKGKVQRNYGPAIPNDDPTLNHKANTTTDPVLDDAKKLEVLANCELDGVDYCISSDQKQLDRFRENEMHGTNSFTAEEYKCLEATDLEDFCPNYSGADTCEPDTFESMPENVVAVNQRSIGGISSTELEKEEITFDNSNGSSEKTDFDSLGEDIAKSMMTVLLPRALPLLTYTSRKKRKKNKEKFNVSSDISAFKNNGDEKMTSLSINEAGIAVQHTTLHINSDHTEAVAFDCLEVDQGGPQDTTVCHLDAKRKSKCSIPQNTACEILNEEDMSALDCVIQELMDQDCNKKRSPVAKGNNHSSPTPEDSKRLLVHSTTEEKKLAIMGISGNNVDYDSEQNHKSACLVLNQTISSFSQKSVFPEGMLEYYIQIDVADREGKMLPEDDLEVEKVYAVTLNNGVPSVKDDQFGINSMLRESTHGVIIDLVGCYNHPWPVLSVLLSPSEDHVNICVVCGLGIDSPKTLFFYKVSTDKPRMGCPSFVGHAPATFPSFSNLSGTSPERSLKFTPSGKSLVMFGSIKAPYCRGKSITCSCSTCDSVSFSENALKVVQVNFGYVTVLVELQSLDRIVSILVCEPNYLVALGESGRMQIWLMNQSWSVSKEEFNLPTRDCFSSLVELQKIPQFPHWVVGYSGFGEFSLWDISRRTVVSRFSCPDHSIRHFIPITAVRWHLGPTYVKGDVEELVDQIAYGKVTEFGDDESHSPLQGNKESIAVWLLVSTEPNCYGAYSDQKDTNAPWRLALLAKSVVIMGSVVDPKVASVGALSGHGIVGTVDGSIYLWELSTGTKVITLHHLQGERVSCIVTGDSNSCIFAASGEGGKLVIYRRC